MRTESQSLIVQNRMRKPSKVPYWGERNPNQTKRNVDMVAKITERKETDKWFEANCMMYANVTIIKRVPSIHHLDVIIKHRSLNYASYDWQMIELDLLLDTNHIVWRKEIDTHKSRYRHQLVFRMDQSEYGWIYPNREQMNDQ